MNLQMKKLNQLNLLFKNNNNNNNKTITLKDKILKLESQDYLMMLPKKMLKLISILLLKLNQLIF